MTSACTHPSKQWSEGTVASQLGNGKLKPRPYFWGAQGKGKKNQESKRRPWLSGKVSGQCAAVGKTDHFTQLRAPPGGKETVNGVGIVHCS